MAKAADLPNVVAIKHEVGRPGLGASYEFWKMIRDKRILFSDPLEANSPLTVELFGQQWMGTSNYKYFGGTVPQYFKLLREGEFERAMKIYWQIQPARGARMAEQASFGGANFIHRYMWLNGGQMRRLREALVRAGLEPSQEDPAQFYIGRNPA